MSIYIFVHMGPIKDSKVEDDPLHEACINGTLEQVKRMVYSGKFQIDCRQCCSPYFTPLGLVTAELYGLREDNLDSSVVRDYEEKIKFLLQNGADYKELIEPYGFFTDVGEVILREGNKNMFNFMLNFLEDINRQHGLFGDTTLHIAIERGFFKTTRKILSMNADVNLSNFECKETPIHRAIFCRRTKFVNLLIKHGANMESTDREGRTPLDCACYYYLHNKDIIEKCMEYNSIYSRTTKGYTPMHTIVSRAKKATTKAAEVVELFLDRGYDLETEDFQGRTPLLLSLKKKIGPMVSLFLRNGAHLEINDLYDAYYIIPNISRTEVTDERSRTILKFIALEVSRGVTIQENLREILSEREEASNYLNTCYKEIDILKSIKIENTTVTYWTLLTKSIKQIAFYANNYSITEEIRTFELSSYPIYGPDILYKFAKGKRRLELMNECADKLNRMWEWKLPSVFVDMVIDRLSIADMKNVKSSMRHLNVK